MQFWARARQEAWREMAATALPASMIYPLCLLICAFNGPFLNQHPRLMGLLIAFSAILGLGRVLWSRRMPPVNQMTLAWPVGFALLTLAQAACWSIYSTTAVYLYGTDWNGQLAALISAGLATGALTTLSGDIRLYLSYAAVLILAPALTLLAEGSRAAYLLLVYLGFIMVIASSLARRHLGAIHYRLLSQERSSALEDASRAKSRFLATMSHEIRTPMNAIFGMTTLLMDTPLSEQQKEWVAGLRDSCDSLLSIISDVLDLSKIEAGQFQIDNSPFDVKECLMAVVALFQPLARQRGLDLTAGLEPLGKDYWVKGDRTRFRQIVSNFLSNAIKFTHEGKVHLSCQLHAEGSEIEVQVHDTGIGVRAEQFAAIFEPFIQGDASTTRQYHGTGLGLAICQQLAELMGGRVWVWSGGKTSNSAPVGWTVPHPQEGSTFCFRLPVVTTTAPLRSGEVNLGEANLPPRQVRILIAEDNPVNHKVAAALLKRLGFTSQWVVNGHDCVEFCKEQPVDLVFMDLQMPIMDGLEATVRLRQAGLPRQPWIVALTANAFPEDRERCLRSGMDDYLSKPIQEGRLIKVLVKFAQQLPRAASAS